jgi:hypothetical protein
MAYFVVFELKRMGHPLANQLHEKLNTEKYGAGLTLEDFCESVDSVS